MGDVLVVDDEDHICRGVARILSEHGHRVLPAAGAEEAIDAIKRSVPDVMITDLQMEGAGGIELISAVRQLAPEVKPVLMSAFASAEDHQRATDLGAVTVLTKPFTPDQVITAVQHALDCDHGFRGMVHGISLVDLLQMFHFARRSIGVRLGAVERAEIVLRDGEIVHAQHGSQTGFAALRALISMSTGCIRTFVPSNHAQITVTESFQALLMDVLREADETGRSQQQAVANDLESAFEEWASLRPEAVPENRLRMLSAVLDRVAPQLGAAIVDEVLGRVISVRQLASDPAWLDAICGIDAELSTLTGSKGVELFELVRNDIAVAVIRIPANACAVVLDSPLVGRLAMHRFRSQVRQVLACLASE